MIRCLKHVGLGVRDLDRSLEFYRDFLGMEVLIEIDASDDRIGRIIGKPCARCRIVHLRRGEGVLELLQYYRPVGESIAAKTQQWDQGLIHMGFDVTDIHKHVEELKKRNIEFLGELVEFRAGVWIVYFRGPDGEIIEFRQLPEHETNSK